MLFSDYNNMENFLLKYMVERFHENDSQKHLKPVNFPFITISREYGCPSKEIAKLVVHKLNLHKDLSNKTQIWRMISKEILEEASKELKVDIKRIEKFFNVENKGNIDEILNSLSEKYYHSDKKIKKILSAIIVDIAKKGNVVIVGRAGVCVTNELKNGLHIRLIAPLEWRAEQLFEKKYAQSLEDAKKLAIAIDYKREKLLKIMSNNTFNDAVFNLTYNCQFFSKEEIADSVIYHLGFIYKPMD